MKKNEESIRIVSSNGNGYGNDHDNNGSREKADK